MFERKSKSDEKKKTNRRKTIKRIREKVTKRCTTVIINNIIYYYYRASVAITGRKSNLQRRAVLAGLRALLLSAGRRRHRSVADATRARFFSLLGPFSRDTRNLRVAGASYNYNNNNYYYYSPTTACIV